MYLYCITDEAQTVCKIGYSEDPEQRCRTLQTGNHSRLSVYHTARVDDNRARLLEQQLHKEINHHRTRGEWFKMKPATAAGLIDYIVIRYHDDALLGF